MIIILLWNDKYYIHVSSSLNFHMKPYWKFYQWILAVTNLTMSYPFCTSLFNPQHFLPGFGSEYLFNGCVWLFIWAFNRVVCGCLWCGLWWFVVFCGGLWCLVPPLLSCEPFVKSTIFVHLIIHSIALPQFMCPNTKSSREHFYFIFSLAELEAVQQWILRKLWAGAQQNQQYDLCTQQRAMCFMNS